MIRLFAVLSLSFAFAAPAVADEVIATGQAGNAPEVLRSAAPDAEALPTGGRSDYQEVVRVGPCTPGGRYIARAAEADGVRVEPDREMHGEVSAGIGTNGYRSFSGSVCKPIGDDSYVAVSAGYDRMDGRRWKR